MTCLTCDLHNWLLENYTWEQILRRKIFTTPMGEVTVVQAKEYRSDYNSYGEYDQGTTEKVWIVLQLEDANSAPRFFRKDGTHGSYDDDVSWDGGFREVSPKDKKVTVYEWDE